MTATDWKPSIKELNHKFIYNKKEGGLIWKNNIRKSLIGKKAGNITRGGRRSQTRTFIRINGKTVSIARVVWAIHNGKWSNKIIDHINRNTLDDRIENLRECDASSNSQNRTSWKSKSGIRGAYKYKRDNKYYVFTIANKKRIFLGSFTNKKDAKLAYEEGVKKYHGEFCYLNKKFNASRGKI